MIKTNRENLVFKNQFVEFFNDDVTFQSGKVGTYYRLGLRDSIQVIPVTLDSKIVLIEVFRYALGKTMLELPAGGVDRGESIESAAKRELLEETGLIPPHLSWVGSLKPIPSVSTFSSHQFIGWGCDTSSLRVLDADESILSVKAYSLTEVYKMMQSGMIEDMSSYALLAKFFLSFGLDLNIVESKFDEYEMLFGAFLSSMGKSSSIDPFRNYENGPSDKFLSGYRLHKELKAKK